MQNFVEALDLDCEPILNAAGARDIAATVQAALESAHSGNAIEPIQ